MHFGLIGGILRQDLFMGRASLMIIRVGRVVPKLRVLDQMPDHIDAKTVDALAEPEPHHVVDRLAHLGVAPVQVRLLGEKGVIIILSGCLIIAARRCRRTPIASCSARRRPALDRARCTSRASDCRATTAFDKPRMLIGGMVRHQIEDNLETGFMRRAHQRVEIRHRAEQRVDAGIVGNVVTEIGHRRWKDRR